MDKKIGYLLLVCGLGLLIASAVMLWKVIYGTMEPPQAFEGDSAITLTMPTGATVNVPLPPHINRFANLSLAFLLMFFLVLIGGKIGGLGVNLINGPAVNKEPAPKEPARNNPA
ncbi:MAG: hypothetical protein Q7R35_07020 [Elusimicrobiota bacterium]|nr:hypothetical protein [Elusimicrobiota bacterium]